MSDMTFPEAPSAPPPKKTNWKVIIPIVIVVILCCLCIVVVGVLAYMGSQGEGPLASLMESLITSTDISGDWNMYWSWDCTDQYSSGSITFYSDGTYNVDNDSSLWGTWQVSGGNVDFIFDEEPYSRYVGTITSGGTHMEGTMDNTADMSGCWYTDR